MVPSTYTHNPNLKLTITIIIVRVVLFQHRNNKGHCSLVGINIFNKKIGCQYLNTVMIHAQHELVISVVVCSVKMFNRFQIMIKYAESQITRLQHSRYFPW
uniref:Uncharacterized protein n=1 Tax=Arundo donax TaxID=35708 RepID=A0A0A9BV58_ARUDO